MRAGHVGRGRYIAPAHEGPHNESSNKAHDPTSGRSTHYGSGPLIRVVRDIGRIFSSLCPFTAVLFLSRFARSQGLVILRQTFVPRCQPRRRWGLSGLDLKAERPFCMTGSLSVRWCWG